MQKLSRFSLTLIVLIVLCAGIFAPQVEDVEAKPLPALPGQVVISEVAWGGFNGNSGNEWIELHNTTNSSINLMNWRILAADGSPNILINVSETIPANGYYLLESTEAATSIASDFLYSGTLSNTSENLTLYDNSLPIANVIDTANNGCSSCWYDGSGSPDYFTMERVGFASDTASDWISSSGTPRNSRIDLALSMNLVSTTGTVPPYDVTYSITVTNQGYGTAINLQVTNILPPDFTSPLYTSTAGTVNSGIWDIASLTTGDSETLTITATMNTIGSPPVINRAQITRAEIVNSVNNLDPDSSPANCINPLPSEDDCDEIKISSSILDITNTVNNEFPNIGTNIVFTINVSNPSLVTPANNVSVDALLPNGLSFVSSSSGSYNGGTGIWTIGTLATGANATLTITATVLSSAQMTLIADVSSTEFGNNSASATVTPNPNTQANLSLIQTWSRSTSAADTAILNITVNNNEASVFNEATNVQVKSLLPSGLTYVSHTSGQTYNSSTGIWAVGTIAGGANRTLSITVRVSASGTSTSNFAEIWQSDQFDPTSTPANGDTGEDDSESDEVLVADLSLTQTVDITNPNAVFTFRVTNSGPDDATNIKVDNTRLAQPSLSYDYISHSATSGTYNDVTGEWSINSLADGATAILIVTTTIISADENWAEVDSVIEVDPDSLPNNNSRNEDDDAASPSADLSITKIISSPSTYQNSEIDSNITFRITVTNSGFANATGVEVKDLLPAGLTYVSHTSGQTYNKTSGIWTVGNLSRNASASLDITAKVTAYGIRTNWAEVWKSAQSDPDSDPGDGSIISDDDASASITSYRSVIINEVAWSGTAASAEDEWIELYNPSDTEITITNWTLRKDSCSGSEFILLSGKISKDGFFLLERGDNTTVSDISANQIYVAASALDDAGETLYLCDNLGNFIDTANQQGSGSSSNPWPQGNTSTTRPSMERKNASTENDASWVTNDGITKNGLNASGGAIYGTPSKKNSVTTTTATAIPAVATSTPAPPPIDPRPILNEIHARPGFDWNQDGRVNVFDEFIEIKNLTAIDITLKGWKLDKPNSTSFALPDVTLKPNERIVFYSLETNLLLSDGGETVRLINSSGKIYDAFTYTIAKTEDESFCRLPDGNVNNSWFDDCTPTPNETNTRKGTVPTSPGGDVESPTCDLPDTIPADFFFAECRGYGANIWNPLYWDELFRIYMQSNTSKWESFIE